MVLSSERTRLEPPGREGAPWYRIRELWAAAAIAVMWLAVLFTGVYGGDAVFSSVDGSSTRLPSAIFVALFAFLASASIARRAFGSARNAPGDRP